MPHAAPIYWLIPTSNFEEPAHPPPPPHHFLNTCGKFSWKSLLGYLYALI